MNGRSSLESVAGMPTEEQLKEYALASEILIAVFDAGTGRVVYGNSSFNQALQNAVEITNGHQPTLIDLLGESQYHRLLDQIKGVTYFGFTGNEFESYDLKNNHSGTANYQLFITEVKSVIKDAAMIYNLVFVPDNSVTNVPYTSTEARDLLREQFCKSGFGAFEKSFSSNSIWCTEGFYQLIEESDSDVTVDEAYVKRLIHPDDWPRVYEAYRNFDLFTDAFKLSFNIITIKGNFKTVEANIRVIKNSAGNPIRFVGTLRDITAQYLIEKNLEIKIEQLHLSNKELEEFAYIASHDMQEPLRKISIFISRLSQKYKDLLGEEGALYIDRITASSENLRILINDLLEFSRISQAQLPFEKVDLNQVLRLVRSDLEINIEETHTILQSDPLPVIDAIPSQMKQLFLNIVSNAIKFKKQDCAPLIKINVSNPDQTELLTHHLPLDVQYVKIVFADNGIGFEEAYVQKIFQVFQRLHGRSEYPGSGIGLAICKKISERHKGVIYAEAKPMAGARFISILPVGQRPKTEMI